MNDPIPYRLKRRIEQIAMSATGTSVLITALASDGTLWLKYADNDVQVAWHQLPELPDIEEATP